MNLELTELPEQLQQDADALLIAAAAEKARGEPAAAPVVPVSTRPKAEILDEVMAQLDDVEINLLQLEHRRAEEMIDFVNLIRSRVMHVRAEGQL